MVFLVKDDLQQSQRKMKKQAAASLCIPCCAVPTGDEDFLSVSSWKSATVWRICIFIAVRELR